ncbi:DNA primase [Clostridium fermenticellae]|uniref:DNA primase n=1 Tax=Clostridium fermenticellae TaxID=2068654 RepID=A0A386H5E0_9CLOT|nr:DNA primase [Clostridium fermenticellae]AYD40967.1 DNA primase [Clostridium fermenticellae]
MISEDVIEKVKYSNDIVDVISETVKLKRSGRNYTGLCPFHNEKTPSFSVSVDRQIYKCFGCGEAGNVITFIMKTRNLTFPEAVEFLADRANIDIQFENKGNTSLKESFQKLYKINVETARYFFNCLQKNKIAKKYFIDRGITETTIRKFGLGYSPPGWNNIIKYLSNKGFTELDMLKAGIIIKSQKGSYYDRFRNRVMFPVFDYRGRVIGFGGRVMDDSKPKYLNSPETTLFKKGINLYGLNFAIKGKISRELIIVEGYMDCISLHQYGINNAVASLGTALTQDQARLIKKYADKVIISYDADTAGQMATMRGIEILKEIGLDVRVLTIPQGKDPDEFVRNNGKESFLKLVDTSFPLIDYKISKIKGEFDFKKSQDIVLYSEKVLEVLKGLDPIEKGVYIKQLSEQTNIREQALYDILNSKLQKNVKKQEKMNIDNNFGQKLYLEPAYVKAERWILRFMLEDDELLKYIVKNFNDNEFIIESHKKIYNYIIQNTNYEEGNRKQRVESECKEVDTEKEWINISDLKIEYDKNEYKDIIEDYINVIKRFKLQAQKQDIMNEIKKCESDGRTQESIKLAQKLIEIQKKIGGIQ